ncbi:MAG: hypothetical protein DHS20C18_55020 [Saprospiraceae bacterium]|nr:MAG: hypothetical protein DHS20C18_55020 [Saprospiraceae bacterium]
MVKQGVYSLLLVFFPLFLSAQLRDWSVGLMTGFCNYGGDLVSGNFIDPQATNFSVGLLAQSPINSQLDMRLGILGLRLSGNDLNRRNIDTRKERAFRFSTNVTEITALAEWHFLGKRAPIFSPYISSGFALIIIDPQPFFDLVKDEGLIPRIDQDKTANYAKVRLALPINVGVKWKIDEIWNIGLDLGLRTSFTDYLDGISVSANPKRNDWYGYFALNGTYRLHPKDSDGDGIADKYDECPNLPGLKRTYGCPDTDGDGMADHLDYCPFEIGSPILFGCPDDDGDGISNQDDPCPNNYGPPERNGCPFQDSDGDGVEDYADGCPFVVGPPERDGCPAIDSDGDGLLDEDDRCPNVYGIPVFVGCPDTDGDGIEDAKDACPNDFGVYEENGCPLIINPEEEAKSLSRQLLFFNRNSVEIERYILLDKIAGFLLENPHYRIKIKGFSDSAGSESQNLETSRKRARACFDYFVSQGIRSANMRYTGYGSGHPIASNQTEEGRQQNRRVEFQLYHKDEPIEN